MVKRILVCTAAVFSLLFFAFLSLCLWASFYVPQSTSCQLASGRQIVCTATGIYIALETQQDSATIRTLSHTVVIGPTKLQVDGRHVASIPPSTKLVNVAIENGEVQFVADDVRIGAPRR